MWPNENTERCFICNRPLKCNIISCIDCDYYSIENCDQLLCQCAPEFKAQVSANGLRYVELENQYNELYNKYTLATQCMHQKPIGISQIYKRTSNLYKCRLCGKTWHYY